MKMKLDFIFNNFLYTLIENIYLYLSDNIKYVILIFSFLIVLILVIFIRNYNRKIYNKIEQYSTLSYKELSKRLQNFYGVPLGLSFLGLIPIGILILILVSSFQLSDNYFIGGCIVFLLVVLLYTFKFRMDYKKLKKNTTNENFNSSVWTNSGVYAIGLFMGLNLLLFYMSLMSLFN